MSVTTSQSLTRGDYGSSRVGLKKIVAIKGAKSGKKPYSRPPGSKGPWKHPAVRLKPATTKTKKK